MPLTTSPITASSKIETQTPTAKPVDSNLSDVVRAALPIIAMLAGFVFLPLEGALLFTSMIIGGYIYYDCSDKKTSDKTGEEKPSVPTGPGNEASKVPSTESAKKKQRKISDTPPTSASKVGKTAKSYITPKSSGDEPLASTNSKSSTPIQSKREASKVERTESAEKKHRTPSSEERFGRQARLRMNESAESSDDEPVSSVKTPAPRKSDAFVPATASPKQKTPQLSQSFSTPFVERFGPDPTAITFSLFEDALDAPAEGSNMPTTPQASATSILFPDSPYNKGFSPPFTEQRIFYEIKDEKPTEADQANQSLSHTPKLNTSLPPRHPRSNRATDVRNSAIAIKYRTTPKSRKRLSSLTPAPASSGSEIETTEMRSAKKRSVKTPASSESEHSDTPSVRRGTPRWNSSTNPRSKKKNE